MTDSYQARLALQLAKELPFEYKDDFELDGEFFAEEQEEPEITIERHALIFEVANQVAIEKAMSVSYSNFHTWEHLRNFDNANAASTAATLETLKRFQNCCYMAHDCAEALRARLHDHEDLAEYASHVMLATDNWEQRAKSSREYHCTMMLPLPEACIIIDPVSSLGAIKVALNTTWENGFSAFRWCYAGINDFRFLVNVNDDPQIELHYPKTRDTPTYNHPYRTLQDGFEGGVRKLVYPSDNYRGRTPSNRCMFIYGVWDKQPSPDVDAVKVRLRPDQAVHFVVETCRISFSFQERWIWVSNIPIEWLKDPDNANIRKRLEPRAYYYSEDDLWKGFQVDLKTRADI
ncbi:hypothetical protein PtrSN002B_009740 [Pyrenophora tritici-repentis]|uniref:Uncharacterized protein n=2 Tax=Pyrenophora tritici-repentis TaxID=45151 RepID=A0A2W1FTB1_9PLEO|nr:uncharacterized protein PTRG_09222 [Pyrenophora tritici-repentis Pt-1C-BFP]KAA8611260.1 hypothetical protein PtrV1_13921 [Pyrenophora tritici-repentis]EDU42273.1 predicted protein [Pyrenophora tritici-repentis Pt-1C-BFP]KAF7442134.1 hypothetical protein A1F99_130030 [Pyrenophora tritici-repentis]KAF7579504.1 hypothetical protein PtrM4_037440 [Pyrenophora tritici-repentis]KAG9378408.1 hypothetical protein A1F94_011524 [Pyrenophora tritici-repentis]